MKSKFNTPVDPRVSLPKIIVLSFLPGIIFGVFTYYFFEWYILSYRPDLHQLNLMYAALCTINFYLLSVYVGITYGRIFYRRSSSKSIKNFKAFTDALHESVSEISIYENLHSYLSNVLPHTKITIFYKELSEESQWHTYPNGTIPICNMSHKTCPVITQQKECFVNDIQSDLTCAYQLPFYKSGSYICLLGSVNKKPQYVLQMFNPVKGFFDADTVNDIRGYIESTNTILDSKLRLKTLNVEAYTDKLTQVKNRTFLEQEILRLMEHSENTGEPMSLIICDLDFFKKVNDTYGHPAGDVILVEFAQLISSSIRSGDQVFRYGGEEFIVLLPNANIAVATAIAERVRNSVANAIMPFFQGVQLPRISCSLGISTFPDYAKDKANLINTADLALYAAKHAGRNRAIAYDPYDASLQLK